MKRKIAQKYIEREIARIALQEHLDKLPMIAELEAMAAMVTESKPIPWYKYAMIAMLYWTIVFSIVVGYHQMFNGQATFMDYVSATIGMLALIGLCLHVVTDGWRNS